MATYQSHLHVSQLLEATKNVHDLKIDSEHFKDVMRDHGLQLRELYRVVSSSATKAELNIAVQVTREPKSSKLDMFCALLFTRLDI